MGGGAKLRGDNNRKDPIPILTANSMITFSVWVRKFLPMQSKENFHRN